MEARTLVTAFATCLAIASFSGCSKNDSQPPITADANKPADATVSQVKDTGVTVVQDTKQAAQTAAKDIQSIATDTAASTVQATTQHLEEYQADCGTAEAR